VLAMALAMEYAGIFLHSGVGRIAQCPIFAKCSHRPAVGIDRGLFGGCEADGGRFVP
jgi:hypothetical protein